MYYPCSQFRENRSPIKVLRYQRHTEEGTERDRQGEGGRARERVWVRGCVCVRERERERE